MSRCFPFPPPGYESKPRTDHVELLTKEKHRKKKHKEKRDKEKGERKDKKERDRSKDKHKEKKDGKEKHKDDKKDKNREKKQSRTSEDRTEEWAEGQHELKVGESGYTASDFKGSKLTESFKRLRDEEKGPANAMVENFSSSTRRRIEGISDAGLAEKGRVTDKQMAPSQRGTDGIERQKVHFADPIKRDVGLGMETSMEKERGTSNQVVPNLIVANKRKHATGQAVVNFLGSTQQRVEGKSAIISLKERATKCDDNKMASNLIITDQTRNHATVRQVNITDVSQRPEVMPIRTALEIERFKPNPVGTLQGNHSVGSSVEKILIVRSGVPGSMEKERGKGNKVVPSLIGTEERSNGMGQSTGRGTNNSTERKENIRDKESDEYKGDGQSNKKSRDTERSKDGHKGKEKKKVSLKDEHKHKKEHNSTRDNGKADPIHNLNSIHLPPCKDNANGFVTDGNIKKRGGSGTNDFLHENDARPNKHRIISPSSHPLKNGRISLDPFNTSMPSFRDGTKNNTVAEVIENMEDNINGITEVTEPPISSAKLRHPVPAGASVNKVSSRPPHPDSKYLDRIYAIPKMEELPEPDEWLFRSNDLRSKPKAKLETEETPQVWSKALCIESEDVVALPYVVPF